MIIISQPGTENEVVITSAYRPIVFDVEYLDNPPVAYCDIYFNCIYYKTISKTFYEYGKVFRFDISDASQEYLKSELPPINGHLLNMPENHYVICLCKFRTSGYDSNGFIVQETIIPIQGTSTSEPVMGDGLLSSLFCILNVVLQHEDNQNLRRHLRNIGNSNRQGSVIALTHRPIWNGLCDSDSDYFPVWVDSEVEVAGMYITLYKKNGAIENIIN